MKRKRPPRAGLEAEVAALRGRLAERDRALAALAEILRDVCGLMLKRGERLSRSDRQAWADALRLKAEGLSDREVADSIGTTRGALYAMRYRRKKAAR